MLCELSASQRHIIVTATHDGELVDLLRNTYVPYHFTDSLGPHGLVFDYRLQAGPATTRNAITLLKLHGAPDGWSREPPRGGAHPHVEAVGRALSGPASAAHKLRHILKLNRIECPDRGPLHTRRARTFLTDIDAQLAKSALDAA